ncbi:MAG: PD-(D/E)XK nuclease family transposase, partial [Bacteroidales bacterium]|nr:PD-(D/E)XK nuclease family transposase [Bacteroidales bacterium]
DQTRFIHKFSLREDETHEQLSRALRFAFLEIARFDKPKEACGTFEDRFLYLLKNLPTFAEQPDLWDDPYFDELMDTAAFANMTFDEQEAYIASMKQKWDYQNSIDFAEMKGDSRGYERGKAEGIAEGLAATARRMLAMGFEVAVVAKATGLTEEQIMALQ